MSHGTLDDHIAVQTTMWMPYESKEHLHTGCKCNAVLECMSNGIVHDHIAVQTTMWVPCESKDICIIVSNAKQPFIVLLVGLYRG
jgi:hypothetical protein